MVEEHFGQLLDPINTSSMEGAESEDSGKAPPISLAEDNEVVLGLDEICPEMMKALEMLKACEPRRASSGLHGGWGQTE